MNIIIPLGGKGERFLKEGFLNPKPLIRVFNKEIIFYVLDNLNIRKEDCIFIIYKSELDTYNFSNIIKEKYLNIQLIPIDYQTTGAVETIDYGLSRIISLSKNKKCVLLDGDTFYTQDILSIVRNTDNNMVFYTQKNNEPPIYSYIKLNSDNKILNILEKTKISSNANTGCYVFNNIEKLLYYCKYVLDNKITYNEEPYTSCVIGEMIKTDDFFGYELNSSQVFSLGTPSELLDFEKKTYVFLLDLDGTLVITDHIYLKVWKQILIKYNISIDADFFMKYIHGNSDYKVVNMLLPNCDVEEISKLKDCLFIENISEIKIIDGVIKFLKTIKENGYFCSIVSNCNRKVATEIIKQCNFDSYIDYITIGNECLRTKPYPDPYIDTIKKYNISPQQVFIFEDSKSGLLSARLSNVLCVVGITTSYITKELIETGANITICDYNNINMYELISYNNLSMENISSYIKKSVNLKINEIKINETKLKGGFISDIIALNIITDTEVLNCVIKLENKSNTTLSRMANKLGLYERENYFYDNISKYINVQCPKFYGLIRDDNFDIIGILMEDLNVNHANILNLNLNITTINVSLGVIDKLARMHSRFWNKDLKKAFPYLKKHTDPIFNPVWSDFINEKYDTFVNNWKNILNTTQFRMAENIKNDFKNIQESLSVNNLTIIHGDVKSPNIFYNSNNDYEPIFLDWQYVAIGKGVQDLVFFLIESFDIENININIHIFKNYYYRKLIENGVLNYSFSEYEIDFKNAVCYFPFFVAIWFGTTSQDELIDKNFPFFFIQKLFFCLEKIY